MVSAAAVIINGCRFDGSVDEFQDKTIYPGRWGTI